MMDDRELARGTQGQLGDELHAAVPKDIDGFKAFQTGVDQLHQEMSKP
jgi:hypothetical protein